MKIDNFNLAQYKTVNMYYSRWTTIKTKTKSLMNQFPIYTTYQHPRYSNLQNLQCLNALPQN